jgi:pimeloyl-ACP methyl ester carboxylesterase
MADVVARGVRFNVVRMGSGEEVIVLLHGMVVDNLSSWFMTLAPALAQDYSLILYDLRGHGRTERTATGYRMQDHVADLAAILDELGLGDRPVILGGNSSGGLIALMFALRYPERVERLFVVDAHSGMPDFGEQMARTFFMEAGEPNQKARAILESWREQLRARPADDPDAQGLLWGLKYTGQRKRRNPLLAKMELLVNETSLSQDLLQTEPVTDDDLRRITIPTLAVYGGKSDLLPDGQRIAACVPNCEFKLLPDAAHFILMRETATVRDCVMAWLKQTQR